MNNEKVFENFRNGMVIPAVPLALDEHRKYAPERQRALIRYYIDAGAGGVAVGVHSTQFEIRDPSVNMFEKVLANVSQYADEWSSRTGRYVMKIAGVCGKTAQAQKEAEFAKGEAYHACLLSLSAMKNVSPEKTLNHVERIAQIMPVIGFYLQPAVGGGVLNYEFWRGFVEIHNVIGIKIAPFNRYHTLDVIRAVCDSGAEGRITLYTGNDDNILTDLLTEYRIKTSSGTKKIRIKGGLLGHWCVWTKKAVELLAEVHRITENGKSIPPEMLTRAIEISDCNAAFFDAANNFAGCIPGLHEILRRQGIFKGRWCINPKEKLSPGQKEEIDRVCQSYPHLNDDEFVAIYLKEWLEK